MTNPEIRRAIMRAFYETWQAHGLSGWNCVSTMADEFGLSKAVADREVEYLEAKGLLKFAGKGRASITVAGVDYVEREAANG